MLEDIDLFQTARDGARAVAAGDGGRSAHLLDAVVEAMRELTLDECEWLSIAVTNGAFSRQMAAPPAEGDVNMTKTQDGEIWDI